MHNVHFVMHTGMQSPGGFTAATSILLFALTRPRLAKQCLIFKEYAGPSKSISFLS